MEITSFGALPDGREAHAYELSTSHARVRVCDYGATLLGAEVPDRDGSMSDVVLGFSSVEGYVRETGACYGGVIGPMANRTDRAEVPIDGTVYHLLGNDGEKGENNLHSDLLHGLHKRLWEAEADEGAGAVRFSASGTAPSFRPRRWSIVPIAPSKSRILPMSIIPARSYPRLTRSE